MEESNMKKLIIALVLIITISIAGTDGALAFPAPPPFPPPNMEQLVKDCLSKLITSGTINEDQANTASNYLKQNNFDPKKFDPLKIVNDLKNMGLTDKQAQAIVEAVHLPQPPEISSAAEQNLKDSLNKLVNSGTITQEQFDKLSNYLKQNNLGSSKNCNPLTIVNDLKNMGLTEKQAQVIADTVCSPKS